MMESDTKIAGNLIQVLEDNLDPWAVIKQIVQDGQEDGFYVCDVSDIVQKYRVWKQAMPRVKPFYAVKCNGSRVVLETLAALDIGFDCASKEEITNIMSLGVTSDRIILANPAKKPSQIKYAAEVGVTTMTFDSESELYKIQENFPNANLVLRLRYDDPTALYIFGDKFGADPKTKAKDLLILARSLDLNVIGVSFHIGSGCKDFSIYTKAIAGSKLIFNLGSDLGYTFTLLDIGGGFPGNKNNCIEEIGETINKALARYFPDLSVQIIAEPGRYYVNSAFTLATNIHTTKTMVKPDQNKDVQIKMYHVDISLYGSLLSGAFGDQYFPQPLYDDIKSPIFSSVVWGNTCDSCDKICDNVPLPDMKVGDWLVFEDVGAYSLSLSSEFNGFPAPNVHTFISTEDWLFLTENVSSPVSKKRYIKGKSPLHFRTGLDNTHLSLNKYF